MVCFEFSSVLAIDVMETAVPENFRCMLSIYVLVSFYTLPYVAFLDARNGMVNLVVEYMDGGSLEDLVSQGGCADEMVLADIAAQTCAGLAFLHGIEA